MTPNTEFGSADPLERPSPRRLLFRALVLQTAVTALIVLGIFVAFVGVKERYLILAGLCAGLGCAALIARWLSSRLPSVTSREPGDEALFKALLQHVPWALWITDRKGRITHHNAAAVEWFEQGTLPLLGFDVRTWWSRWAGEAAWAELDETVQRGGRFKGDLELCTQDRTVRLEITAVPVSSGASSRSVLFLAEDVTELRQLGHLLIDLERQSTRGQMAGDVAHEINNFLTILGGNLDILPMLLSTGKHDRVQAKFLSMRQALDKIARFSEGLMGHRDENGEAASCDVNKLIDGLVAFLKPQNRFDGVEWSVRPDPALPPLEVRVGQLKQVLLNLLNNAADAIHQRGRDLGKIEIATRYLARDGEFAVSVRDNGPGLSKAASARIFRERYSEKKSGYGLGLLNCHALARENGGSLTFESSEGQGTTFTLTLPCGAVVPDPEAVGAG